MSPILRSCAIAAAALLIANAEPEEEGEICLTIASVWRGDSADIKRIRSIPVPDSFRRPFEGGGCPRFQLVEQSLVDWHLAFGDERTTTHALAYLEADYRRAAPAPEAFGKHLAAALDGARRTIGSAALPRAGDPRLQERRSRLRKAPGVQRAMKAVEAYSNYVELATGYARAAELYGSPALLRKAEQYYEAARAGMPTLFANGTEPETSLDGFIGAPSRRLYEVLDLEMRLPLLRARLSRAPDDLDRASAAMARRFDPVFETAADNAREHSGDLCEIHGEARGEELQALEKACDDEHSLVRRATAFWRNRAHLDLLMAGDPVHFEALPFNRPVAGSGYARRPIPLAGAEFAGRTHAFETASWLLRYRQVKNREERPARFDPASVELFSLLLAAAEMHARAASSDPEEIEAALDHAAQAALLVPPHDAPALFRRAAERWLELWAGAAQVKEDRRWQYGDRGRFAIYLRTTLGSLDSMALGEAGGRPSPPLP